MRPTIAIDDDRRGNIKGGTNGVKNGHGLGEMSRVGHFRYESEKSNMADWIGGITRCWSAMSMTVFRIGKGFIPYAKMIFVTARNPW